MKTKAFFFVIFLTFIFTPALQADTPPKKDIDKDNEKIIVGGAPFEYYTEDNQSLCLNLGWCLVFVFDENSEVIDSFISYIDNVSILPEYPGYSIVVYPLSSYNAQTPFDQ